MFNAIFICFHAAIANAKLDVIAEIDAGTFDALGSMDSAPSDEALSTVLSMCSLLGHATATDEEESETWTSARSFLGSRDALRKAVALLDPVNCTMNEEDVARSSARGAGSDKLALGEGCWTWTKDQSGSGIEILKEDMLVSLSAPGRTGSSTEGARGTDGWVTGTHTWTVEFQGPGPGTHGAVGICTEACGVLFANSYVSTFEIVEKKLTPLAWILSFIYLI